MNHERKLTSRDLEILQQMSLELSAYLKSEAVKWTMARGDMPPLTLGGCLMRCHRLAELIPALDEVQRKNLSFAAGRIDKMLADNLVLFEKRAHQELHARMSEWMGHLRGWSQTGGPDTNSYRRHVDTRLVIAALVDELSRPPNQLDPQTGTQLQLVDNHLRAVWQEGDFVMDDLWQPVYPRRRYWWLYGCPAYRSAKPYPFLSLDPPAAPAGRPG